MFAKIKIVVNIDKELDWSDLIGDFFLLRREIFT